MHDSMTPSHIFIDRKRGTISILCNGTWWRLPLDGEVGKALVNEYSIALEEVENKPNKI